MNMFALMKALKEVGYPHMIVPDHAARPHGARTFRTGIRLPIWFYQSVASGGGVRELKRGVIPLSYSIREVREALGTCSRLSLADLPTPLMDCPRLAEKLGGPRILVKREDQTGLAFWGE